MVLYRTRSERLHSDMYKFLGTASQAFCLHFCSALQAVANSCTANLGPAVIIFHETRYTKPLSNCKLSFGIISSLNINNALILCLAVEESAEDKLRKQFTELGFDIQAFSSLRYVGIQTTSNQQTNYEKLVTALKLDLDNTTVRSPRQPSVIFKVMRALNQKFSGEIVEDNINPFPEQYFTCVTHCTSCNKRCQRSMGHDEGDHYNSMPCQYQDQYKNVISLCKSCYENGREVMVNYIDSWSYTIITCSYCGEIYRDWKYWSRNTTNDVVRYDFEKLFHSILQNKLKSMLQNTNYAYLEKRLPTNKKSNLLRSNGVGSCITCV